MSARDDVLAALARDGVTLPAKWRVIITDSESPTGVAPVCTGPQSDALHMIDDYPGGPKYDEDGVYDCCPWPQFDTYSDATAAYVVALLNADAGEEATAAATPVRFEEPAPGAPHSIKARHAFAEALRARPKEWALLGRYKTGGSARQSAYNIRRAIKAKGHPFGPPGSFEADARTMLGEHRVYARFVGGESQ